jgi:hypothetical protein
MCEVPVYWAGEERLFRLLVGDLMDLETACNDRGFGSIYTRLASHQYSVREVYHVLRLGLIGGGMDPLSAKKLVDSRFSDFGMQRNVEVAMEVLISVQEGVQRNDLAKAGDPEAPIEGGPLMAALVQAGVDPTVLRRMRHADLVNMLNNMGGKSVQPPDEDAFRHMVANSQAITR